MATDTQPEFDPPDLASVMQYLARLTKSTDEARDIMKSYGNQTSRDLWASVWSIEACERGIALRKKDPDAKIPEEWSPLPLDWR